MCAGEVQKTFHSCHLRLQTFYQKSPTPRRLEIWGREEFRRFSGPRCRSRSLGTVTRCIESKTLPCNHLNQLQKNGSLPLRREHRAQQLLLGAHMPRAAACTAGFTRRTQPRTAPPSAARAPMPCCLRARHRTPRAELSGHAGKHTRCRVMRRARAAPQHAPRRHARWPPPPLRLHFAFCFSPC